jgi:GNAT superfamily N-acetyltransferase
LSTLTIDRRRPEDDEEILRLYAAVFGETLAEGSRRRFRWQYLENPATGPEGPEIWVARDGGLPLGQYASMPVVLWWGGREVRSSWGMDVFVRAEGRGRGLGAKLFTTWADHVEVALGLGLTPSSYGLFKKLGYHDVGPVPFYRCFLDPFAVARRRLGPVLGSVAGAALAAGLYLSSRSPRLPGDVSVRRIEGFGPEYDALWLRTRASYRMCVRRDAAYLSWKYRDCPHRRYDLWEARRGGELIGFAASRHEDYRGLRLGWLLDVFADASDREAKVALISAVLDDFRAAGVARAQAFSMNVALAEDLRRCGFWRGPSPMLFCVHAREAAPEVFGDLGGWHVVFGDSDMDR